MVSFLKVIVQPPYVIAKITRQPAKVMEVKERTTTKKSVGSEPFLLDMRFWLILLMLAAFVGFLVFINPG